MKKRILAIVLCFTMALTSGSFAFAETDEVVSTEIDQVSETTAAEETVKDESDVARESVVGAKPCDECDAEGTHKEDCPYLYTDNTVAVERPIEPAEEEYIPPVSFTQVAALVDVLDTIAVFSSRAFTPIENSDVHTSKIIKYDSKTGEYTIVLEAFLEGKPTTKARKASDVVMVLDQSGSMDYCFGCGDDNADSLQTRYSGLDNEAVYYVKAKSTSTKGTKVYYCDGSCSLTHTKKNSTRPGGWFTTNHKTSNSVGTQYIPSVGDGTNTSGVVGRIFYTDSGMTTPSQLSTTFASNGYYYSSNEVRYYWCAQHGYWHTASPASTCTNTTIRVPMSSSDDLQYYAVKFHHHIMFMHKMSASAVKTTNTYWLKSTASKTGDGIGDKYVEVTYCKTCKAWHSGAHTDTKTKYYPNKRAFYGKCKVASMSRYDSLIQSLTAFKDYIYEDSADNGITNRIAIVGFGSRDAKVLNDDGTVKYYPSNAILSRKANSYYAYPDLTADILKNALQSTKSDTGKTRIDNAISRLVDNGGNTQTYKGVDMARQIFAQQTNSNKKIVVVFTDGQPTNGPSSDKYNGANTALGYAADLKADGITVFTIGVFSGADASTKTSVTKKTPTGALNTSEANKFMHLMSSNYPDARDIAPAYSATAGETGYYLSASSPEDLQEIFLKIGQSITAGGSTQDLDEESVVRDVMSPEFKVDSTREIKFHTEKCTGKVNGNYTFTNDKNTTIDSKLKVVEGTKEDTVEIKGFDYAEYYVAIDKDSTSGTTQETARGRKLVVEIPIEVNCEGGNALATNIPQNSGVYKKSTCYENFKLPTVDIPTDIIITKETIGDNVPAGHMFDFKVTYGAFNGYKTTASTNGGLLEAKAATTKLIETELSGVSTTDKLKDEIVLSNNAENADDVGAIVGSTITIVETVSDDYRIEYSVDGETWQEATYDASKGTATITATVVPGMNIQIHNILQEADLTITKTIQGGGDPEHSFLFNISGNGVDLDVVIPAEQFNEGRASVIVKGLEVGTYTVKEIVDWSWRYEIIAGDLLTKQIEVEPEGGGLAAFTNTLNNVYWLSGDTYKLNHFIPPVSNR